MQDQDIAPFLQHSVQEAIKNKKPVQITGGKSKCFYGREAFGKPLHVNAHQGIINYQPSELVLTARCGTPLSEIEEVLAGQQQMLAFEAPHFASTATLGGMVASGLSGPRRPFSGSVRDFVLGCKMINGKGEILSFGGEVMKNVAGYDVSRLLVGSMGTLGVILEVSFKVLPLPADDVTCCFDVSCDEAVNMMTKLAGYSMPISGLAYYDRILYARISGTEKSVQAARAKLGGHDLMGSNKFWQQLCEHELNFFRQTGDLWRISVAPGTSEIELSGDWFYDWGGALRWLKTGESAQRIFAAAKRLQGHAQLFRGACHSGEVFQPLPEKLEQLNYNIKQAFDPSAVFNPNRLYRLW